MPTKKAKKTAKVKKTRSSDEPSPMELAVKLLEKEPEYTFV